MIGGKSSSNKCGGVRICATVARGLERLNHHHIGASNFAERDARCDDDAVSLLPETMSQHRMFRLFNNIE